MIYGNNQVNLFGGVNFPIMPVQYFPPGTFKGFGGVQSTSGDYSSMSREMANLYGTGMFNTSGMIANPYGATTEGGFWQQLLGYLGSAWNGVKTFGQNVYNAGKQAVQNIISSFSQGRQGNCASIATIKGAMDKYGNNIFNNVQQTGDGGYSIQMKDGTTVKLTAQELQIAKQKSDFKGNDAQETEYATLCYAAMAKRAQMEGHEGARDFSSACDTLNNGEDPLYTAKLLGLKDHIKMVNPAAAAAGQGVVAWSNKHAVFADGGLVDSYGTAKQYDGTDTFGDRLIQAFVFV